MQWRQTVVPCQHLKAKRKASEGRKRTSREKLAAWQSPHFVINQVSFLPSRGMVMIRTIIIWTTYLDKATAHGLWTPGHLRKWWRCNSAALAMVHIQQEAASEMWQPWQRFVIIFNLLLIICVLRKSSGLDHTQILCIQVRRRKFRNWFKIERLNSPEFSSSICSTEHSCYPTT